MDQRLLVITPVRNEAAQIAAVGAALAAQTRPPDRWVVIDDSSTDATVAILETMVEDIPFLELVRATPLPVADVSDHLAIAAEARAFNQALARTAPQARGFTHVAKLDGDIVLSPDYFEALLAEFAADPRLGLAGGVLEEPSPRGLRIDFGASEFHVRGALKCYSVECLAAIGGIEERLGWDTIDEVRARMAGFRTRAFAAITGVHRRPLGSAEGTLRGRARHGRCDYLTGYPLWWVLARSLKTARHRPVGLSGLCFLAGYLRAARSPEPRVDDPAFRRWIRRELAARAATALGARRLAARWAPRRPGLPDQPLQPTVLEVSSQTLSDQV